MHKRRLLQSVLSIVSAFAYVLGQGTLVLAGTTGAITGTVTNTTTHAPLAGATVTATSPSQTVTTKTDARGHYGFLSLNPDTYTISVESPGLQPYALSGETVQSDQNIVLNLTTQKELATIGRVRAQSSSSLVRSGVVSDVYNITPAQQALAAPLGGGNNLNSAYSAIASVPGTLVPISDSGGWGQSVLIRGGDYTQTGYELDGIPINRQFDQYSASPLSNIGNGEVQVYTGNQPVDAQAIGEAGFINQVIKSGTYPGFGNAQFGFGAPGYYHKFSVEYGGASQNHNLSYYFGFLGYNQQNRYVDQYNGAGYLPQYGPLINVVAAGCGTAHPTAGCYTNLAGGLGTQPLGPNGYKTATTFWSNIPAIADREFVTNVHIAVPHHRDGQKDDIQLLYNTGETYNTPNDSMGSFNSSLGDVLNGTATLANGTVIPNDANGNCPINSGMFGSADGLAPLACNPGVQPTYNDQKYFTGPLNARLTAANVGSIQNTFFAGSNKNRAFGANVPLNQGDSETTGFSVGKVQYQHNFSSNAYARLYGYSAYSDRIDNGIVGLFQNYLGAFSTDYLISAHTEGGVLEFADQVDNHNLISFDGGYSYTDSTRTRNDSAAGSGNAPIAYLVSSANPTGGCYRAGADTVAVATYCGGSTVAASGFIRPSEYVLPTFASGGANLVARGGPTLGTEAAKSCGGAPCEYFAVNSGLIAAQNNVRPAFTNVGISDLIKPNEKLTVSASLRFDDFTYNLLQTNNPGNQLLVNSYNASHCVSGTIVRNNPVNTPCPAGFTATALMAQSPAKEDYAHIFAPRVGLTYAVSPTTIVRASYGRFVQPAETSAVDATNESVGVPSVPFYTNFGFPSYARSVNPEVSYNADFSLEQSFPKLGISTKISPFYRRSVDEFVSILVDPKTNFIANINGLNRVADGAEFDLQAGNPSRDGLSANLAYTFTYATAHFKQFSNGGSFVAGANAAIQGYNGYTKTCANNPNLPQCPTVAQGHIPAAPCYAGGAADPTCAAPGTIANPYFNSPTSGLLDPGAAYFPYNGSLGVAATGTSTSYIVPHVASLVLSYKKGPLIISPSIQFQGGSRYGSPLSTQGVAPDSCTGFLATGLAGDPRYPFATAGGAPYDAASCAAAVSIPNPQTGHFDGIGEFVQPNLIATNLSVTYNFNSKVGINLVAANIFNRCFGGSKVPWNAGNVGCAYSQNSAYQGNFYNRGDTLSSYNNQSYEPVLGGALQSVSAGSPLPFELFMNLNLRV